MAEPAAATRVPVVAPDGTPGTVPAEEVGDIEASGGRVLAPAEAKQAKERAEASETELKEGLSPKSAAEAWLAGQHASVRGAAEAFGVPIDALLPSSAQQYISEIEKKHPYLSSWMGGMGTVRGALGAAEIAGAPTSLGALSAPRTVGNVAARIGYGGVENVVQSTAHDINESSLGKADVNGEKLFANIPKHFAIGAASMGLFEGLGAATEAGAAVLSRHAAPEIERQAYAALGREVGGGEEAGRLAGEVAERRLGRLPSGRGELTGALEAEEGALREKATTALAAEHDAARQVVEREGATKVGEVEATAGQGALEAMAKGGERVEAAELAGHAARREAYSGMFGANIASAEAERALGGAARQEMQARAVGPLEKITSDYHETRRALLDEHRQAVDLAKRLEHEREGNASDLGEALLRLRDAGHTPAGKLTPAQFDEILDEYLGIVGHKGDPSTRWSAEQYLREQYKDELLAAASSAGEASQGHVERLQALASDLEKAHTDALAHAERAAGAMETLEKDYAKHAAAAGKMADRSIAEQEARATKAAREAEKTADAAIENAQKVERETAAAVEKARGHGEREAAKAVKAGERRVSAARAEAEAAKAKFERTVAAEMKAAKAKPTEVTPLLAAAKEHGEAVSAHPLVSPHAALGAVLSLAHGHPLTAAMAVLGSLASGRVRAQGNYLAARALRSVSQHLTTMDEAIRRGAARIVGRVAGAAASTAIERASGAGRTPSFDTISAGILRAKQNPSVLAKHVEASLGPAAKDAPDTYASTLAAAQRAQAFLQAVLPVPQTDSRSLTPHLNSGAVSDTEKDEFMRLYDVVDHPLRVFKYVEDGTIDPNQIEAVKAVYPAMARQMVAETMHNVAMLKKPVDYEREIAIGVLLGTDTTEVLDRDFQGALAAAYEDKSAANANPGVGSKSKGDDAKLAKSFQSTSEKIQEGAM